MLCDFGFTRVRHEFTRILTKMQITQNYRFTAPEILRHLLGDVPLSNIRSTQQSDCYSLGMTFYELGTLRIPFSSIRSPEKAAEAALEGKRPLRPTSLGGLGERATDRLWDLVTAMWRQDPQCRPSLENVRGVVKYLKV